MEALARFLVKVCELFEAEGVALKRQVARLAAAAGLGAIVLALLIAALAFLLVGLFRVLCQYFSPTGASLVMGAIALVLAWIILACARHLLK